MKINTLAVRMVCAIALANWASPSLPAQQSTASTNTGPGQQGAFDGDHQDTGAAVNDGKEIPDSGKETPEVAESTTENIPDASTDTDRVQDAVSDMTAQ
ncbi:MAG: hypothetical protein QOE55_501 [Acidobacteriaceae bacterium]|jgi:hypothetical protein|nr:hypothetical protein [Acidobacteriaceae bacterium]MEA3006739.1 hypothetical protein [Acidobacteriaceae bacterium]